MGCCGLGPAFLHCAGSPDCRCERVLRKVSTNVHVSTQKQRRKPVIVVQKRQIHFVQFFWLFFVRCRFFKRFPTAAAYWARYAKHELNGDASCCCSASQRSLQLSDKNFEQLKSIFERCLDDCPHVDLWIMYLRFVTKVMR